MTDAQAPARNADPCERFEALLQGVLGGRVRRSELDAVELWSALAYTLWLGPQSEQVRYTFRSAGDVEAQLRGGGRVYGLVYERPTGPSG